jgi:hypothetical protein
VHWDVRHAEPPAASTSPLLAGKNPAAAFSEWRGEMLDFATIRALLDNATCLISNIH